MTRFIDIPASAVEFTEIEYNPLHDWLHDYKAVLCGKLAVTRQELWELSPEVADEVDTLAFKFARNRHRDFIETRASLREEWQRR